MEDLPSASAAAPIARHKLNVVAALTRFYADQEESDEAGAVYEKDIASLADAARNCFSRELEHSWLPSLCRAVFAPSLWRAVFGLRPC